MFSQRLASSTESRWRKVGSMMMSFTVHVAFAAILLISPVLVTRVLADHRPGSLVASLNFSPQPGDPSQQESQPNTLQVPHQQIVTLRPDTASKIKPDPEDSVEPENNLLVISSLVAEKPTVAPGFHGSCGCIRPIMPRPETQQETQGKQPIKLPFAGQQSWMHPAVLVKRVDPQYPELAKRAGIQGSVVVHAIIDRYGNVTAASAVNGPQQLRSAAVDAIRQWHYEPYILSGVPVEIETTINVNFVLSGSSGENLSRLM